MKVWVISVYSPELSQAGLDGVHKHFEQFAEIVGVHPWKAITSRRVHYFIEFAYLPDIKAMRSAFKGLTIYCLSSKSDQTVLDRFKTLSSNTAILLNLQKRKGFPEPSEEEADCSAGAVENESYTRSLSRPAKKPRLCDNKESLENIPQTTSQSTTTVSGPPQLEALWTPQRGITSNGNLYPGTSITNASNSGSSVFDHTGMPLLSNIPRWPFGTPLRDLATGSGTHLEFAPPTSSKQDLLLLKPTNSSGAAVEKDGKENFWSQKETQQREERWVHDKYDDEMKNKACDPPSKARAKGKSYLSMLRELKRLTDENLTTKNAFEEERRKYQEIQNQFTYLNQRLIQFQGDVEAMHRRVLKEVEARRTAEEQLAEEREVWKDREERTKLLLLQIAKPNRSSTGLPSTSQEFALPVTRIKKEIQD